jgi:hypothetical protein
MDKQFFHTIFNQNSGFVYKYLGTVPENESVAHYVTNEFVSAIGDGSVSTMVVNLPQFNTIVIYSNSLTDTLSSSKFEVITDLVPDPVLEATVQETTEEPVEGQ